MTTTDSNIQNPILGIADQNETIFYEDTEGFGIYSKGGIEPNQIIKSIEILQNL